MAAWKPWERENVLLLEYEEMKRNLQGVLPKIGDFLQRDLLNSQLPDRTLIASADGRWVRNKTDWKQAFSKELLHRFNEINGEMLEKLGYKL